MKGGNVCVLCVLGAPMILQGVGLLTPKWVTTDACPSMGILYSCCNTTCEHHEKDGPNEPALGLHSVAFAVMFLAVFGMSCEMCRTASGAEDEDETGICGIIGGCCFLLYPVAGLFSFIGCMLLVPKYSTSELGYSFILCLTSSCLTLFLAFILCCGFCCLMCENQDDEENGNNTGGTSSMAMQPYSVSGAAVPYGGGVGAVQVQAATVEQRTVVHDAETGSFVFMIRKMNVFRMVSAFGHQSD